MKITDKVRTTEAWNNHREPIQGTITGFETLKYSKIKPMTDRKSGIIFECVITGQYEYTEVVVLDNGEKIHAINLEVVEE
jgi:hypothetical protein